MNISQDKMVKTDNVSFKTKKQQQKKSMDYLQSWNGIYLKNPAVLRL